MSRIAPVAALALIAGLAGATGPAAAQTALDADAFERHTTGKTLYFGHDGQPYGVERYRDGRRVVWSFLDGRCKDGHWYPGPNDQICFVYEDMPDPQCWQFFLEGGRLIARFGDDPGTVPLYEAAEDDDPMLCLGPEVGV